MKTQQQSNGYSSRSKSRAFASPCCRRRIEQAPGGGFDLDKARRAYIRWLRQRPTRSASQDALERKNGFDIRSAACSDDYSLGVVLGENTDYVDSLRADR